MNIFEFRKKLIDDYISYVNSFIYINDQRIKGYIERELLQKGVLWPEPLIQLNPLFKQAASIDELVEQGVLHQSCKHIFRRDKSEQDSRGQLLHLYRHQEEAIRVARGGNSYVLTTGTGSGKSLAYIIPIVDHVLRTGSGRGIQAIVVYPMNALVNSQCIELERFLHYGYPDKKGPVTFARYTGQENSQEREITIAHPPDILLTNYVMLELILTRLRERDLIKSRRLQFLVLDELHTYRGRQGADVALLVRRVRDRLAAVPEKLQCVGTSATLAGDGTYEQQCAEVAEMTSKIFGTSVYPEHVINETLVPITLATTTYEQQLKERVIATERKAPQTYEDFLSDPLSTWIEVTYGLTMKDGRHKRTRPLSIEKGAERLRDITKAPIEQCRKAIQDWLIVGYKDVADPKTGRRPFAFRLHQFISKGDTVYASLEAEEQRYLTLQRQLYVPDEPNNRERVLLPLVFCRECGQEYYCVREQNGRFLQRELNDQATNEGQPGFLYFSSQNSWPLDEGAVYERIPEEWVEERQGRTQVRRDRKKYIPVPVQVRADGVKVEQEEPGIPSIQCHFVPASFRFCLCCDVSYNLRQDDDFAKLSTLSSEGRSTSTTILSLSAIRRLREDNNLQALGKEPLPSKMLSFTDNRQDASLQAGHFNDFVEVGLLRSALYHAVCVAGVEGLHHDELTQKVFDALNLPPKLYAVDKDAKYQAKAETERAFRNVLGYRLYRDLKRGWRITSPNLEQCGLLFIDYLSLDEVCHDEEVWQYCHDALKYASPETRREIGKTLLDYMRRELAIKVDYLNQGFQESMQQQSSQRLIAPWALDENEAAREYAGILFPRSRGRAKDDNRSNMYLSGRSGFGLYLKRRNIFKDYSGELKVTDTQLIIEQLLEGLRKAALVERVVEPRHKDDCAGYQLPASAIIWKAGDGEKAFHDPIRVPREPRDGRRVNPFFVDFYKADARTLQEIEAREHTAQVPSETREEREKAFRNKELAILYCSPTMELGIDIADLNVVNMRNIPPTPASYAQRSGRAGRGGQPALVFSYCSTGSSHDQYFFKRPDRMVSGAVTPPRLDLANEDLVRSHIHAIWLAETGLSLSNSLKDLLDVSGSDPKMPLLREIRTAIENGEAKKRAHARAARVLATLSNELSESKSNWYTENWLDDVLNRVADNFDHTCDRWRSLYLAAQSQFDAQNNVIRDASRSADDKKQADRLRAEAQSQLNLLTSEVEKSEQSDFYSYRYFATEGFLPGYNFPRLPLSAYIPARRTRQNQRDAYLSRPRFLAISEFAPRAIVYHEGSRYIINRVILSVSEEDSSVTTREAKQCQHCGYLHSNSENYGYDVCENCNAPLTETIYRLFRLQNVATKRRDKINSDEEERMRQGYEIRTAMRFSEKDGRLERYRGTLELERDGSKLAQFSYGSAATLWRINFGWIRRKDKGQLGFRLDTERGYWEKDEEGTPDDPGDSMSQRIMRVIPFVEDRRNCLLFELLPRENKKPNERVMASLQAALKSAIQVKYQLEDNELAAEPLPSTKERNLLLFYEASEGGAGVLRRLIDEPKALAEVAKEALRLCHYDPETGADRYHAPGVQENCEAACYNCLMTYANQRDHLLLDRKSIFDILMEMAQSRVRMSSAESPRLEELTQLAQSPATDLEQKWLLLLHEHGYRLPSATHKQLAFCDAVPDFLYEEQRVAIYVDGAADEYPERCARDSAEIDALEDYGYMVLRFGAIDSWSDLFAQYPYLFGRDVL